MKVLRHYLKNEQHVEYGPVGIQALQGTVSLGSPTPLSQSLSVSGVYVRSITL